MTNPWRYRRWLFVREVRRPVDDNVSTSHPVTDVRSFFARIFGRWHATSTKSNFQKNRLRPFSSEFQMAPWFHAARMRRLLPVTAQDVIKRSFCHLFADRSAPVVEHRRCLLYRRHKRPTNGRECRLVCNLPRLKTQLLHVENDETTEVVFVLLRVHG